MSLARLSIIFSLALFASEYRAAAQSGSADGSARAQGVQVGAGRTARPSKNSPARVGTLATAPRGPRRGVESRPPAERTRPSSEKAAPITIVEFSDLQCPYCGRAAAVTQELRRAYPDKIRFIFKHSPLPNHDKAPLAHEALAAADAQGKLWEMHDLIFANPNKLEKRDLISHARALGLDAGEFTQALEGRLYRPVVEQDVAEAQALGVEGVPTFFVNGRKLVGAQSFAVFKDIIDEDLGLKRAEDAPPAGPAEISTVGAPSKGTADAPISIVLFTDFQCPYCATINPTINQLLAGYGDKARLSLKHFPLDFHADAPLAHEAALAAGAQGKFWEMHDLIFANQRKLKRDDLVGFAAQLNLDAARFAADLDGRKFRAAVEADKREGARLGVDGTPTVFVNGRALSGAQPLSEFRRVIDAELPGLWREPAGASASPAAAEAVDPQLTRGPQDAPVTVVWFSDLQSSLTPKSAHLIGQVFDAYPGKIRLVYKHRPLELRPESIEAHEAALAAARHGKFWEMHSLLLANQNNLGRENLVALAAQLGLPREEFAAALEARTYRAAVEKDLHEARRREVRGSPVFFVNGTRIDGIQPLAMFREAVEAELQKGK